MDFSFTPEQELLRRSARDVLAATTPTSVVRELMGEPAGITSEHWRRMTDLGWLGLIFPEQYGGAGLSMIELAIVLEEMGRVVLPGPFLSTVVAGLTLLRCGSEAQRYRWIAGICDGSVKAALALPEANGSWALEGVTATASREGDAHLLSGSKRFVADGELADVLVCVVGVARDDDDHATKPAGERGGRVDRGAAGNPLAIAVVERAALRDVVALESVDPTRRLASVGLDGVRVEGDDLVSADASALSAVLDLGRVAVAAEMCGGVERVLELTVEYAKVRQQFGQPIGSFQAIQHRCADMLVEVECAKAATYYAAWAAAAAADDASIAAARAKALASDAYRHVTAGSVQVHGGIGFTWEHDLHLYFKRAMSSEALFGDATWNRELVARRLAL